MDIAPDLPRHYEWPGDGLNRIPDWVYTDQSGLRSARSSASSTAAPGTTSRWKPKSRNPGDFIRSNVGPTPVVVSRAARTARIHVFENRCAHRAAEFCRELTGNVKDFVCPYHQWTYDLKGNLHGVPFRRGVAGKGGMPARISMLADHGLRQLNVTTHRGVVFASLCDRTWRACRTISAPKSCASSRRRSTAASCACSAITGTAAGQLEALSREPEGPVSRDAAAHLPGHLRAAGRRQQVADAGRRDRPPRRDGIGQVATPARSSAATPRRRCAPTRKA